MPEKIVLIIIVFLCFRRIYCHHTYLFQIEKGHFTSMKIPQKGLCVLVYHNKGDTRFYSQVYSYQITGQLKWLINFGLLCLGLTNGLL